MTWRRVGPLACALLLSIGRAQAQSVRVTGASWLQTIDVRPLVRDSIPAGTVQGSRGPDGTLVSCPEGSAWCYALGAAARETVRPWLHDVSVAAWGLGEGVSFHAHGRARQSLGSSRALWPRLDDRFDLLDAFVQLERPRVRARLGRQWTVGGLGAYAYDGGYLALRRGALDGEVFGGRSLVQGLAEPYSTAEFGAVEDLPPERGAWLLGVRMRARALERGASASAQYLRVLQDDRSGLYAERASVDGQVRVGGVRLTGSYAADLASGVTNELRLRASRSLPRGFEVTAEGRRHRPFFELWTIWGAFAPVAFSEGRGTVTWRSADASWSVSTSGARRRYDDAGTGLQSVPLRNDGWRLGLQTAWVPDERWEARAEWGMDVGFGSSQSDGGAGLTWRPTPRIEVGVAASALQTIYEFRVGTGRVIGGSVGGAFRLTDDWRLRLDGAHYRHTLRDDALGQDWSQRRASVRLEWALGGDPGTAGGGR